MTGLLDKIKHSGRPRIIICCGSGGVGKTTISAALGVFGALSGQKTIVLTIDPAKRLADTLGLKQFDYTAQPVPLENLLTSHGIPVSEKNLLYAMTLDAKYTFDQLIARYAPPELEKKILNNRYYHHLSSNMAGAHEYMAMEKLYEIYAGNEYELIVLDTPPSRRALDFLDAPQRMLNVLDHNFFLSLFKPYIKAGKWSVRFMNILATPVLKGIRKVLGKNVIDEFTGFMQLWDDIMFEGFNHRAAAVKELLSGKDTLFLAVASPQRLPMNEAIFLYQQLLKNQMPFGGLIINRLHTATLSNGKAIQDTDRLFSDSEISTKLKEKLIAAYRNVQQLAESDARSVHQVLSQLTAGIDVLQIPCVDGEICNLKDLYGLVQIMKRPENF